MNIVCYCGAYPGNDPVYTRAARELGAWIAENDHTLVYGGGKVGMMGSVSDGALEKGGRVIGVIPEFMMEREWGRSDIFRMDVTVTMAERKNRMLELGDAFIALPGGTGTLEEISEAISGMMLGLHKKPCIIYNTGGYYNSLGRMFDNMVREGFLNAEHRNMIKFVSNLEELKAVLELIG
jgi:uncharacterized protein (TIGR00730 family)